MSQHHLHALALAQMLRQLLRQVYRAMLAAGASERHHQILEATTLIFTHARIHQRNNARKKLVHALLLLQVVNHRRVFARENLESLFASGIRKAPGVENKATAISRLVLG